MMNFIEFKTYATTNGLVTIQLSNITGMSSKNTDNTKTEIGLIGNNSVTVNHSYDKVKQMIRKVIDKDYKMYEVHSWENQNKYSWEK